MHLQILPKREHIVTVRCQNFYLTQFDKFIYLYVNNNFWQIIKDWLLCPQGVLNWVPLPYVKVTQI